MYCFCVDPCRQRRSDSGRGQQLAPEGVEGVPVGGWDEGGGICQQPPVEEQGAGEEGVDARL